MWHDLHSATLDLVCQTIQRSEVADRFVEHSLARYMTFVHTTMYHKLESLNVLTELAKFPQHQEVNISLPLISWIIIICSWPDASLDWIHKNPRRLSGHR